MESMKSKTVGELIDELTKYDRNLKVHVDMDPGYHDMNFYVNMNGELVIFN